MANALTGGAGADSLNGGAGNDTLDGGAGDDLLSGGSGDDTLDGGKGVDSAYYLSRTEADYELSFDGFLVRIVGPEGTDTLRGVERIQFTNGHVSLVSLSIASVAADRPEGTGTPTAFTFTVTRTGDTNDVHSVGWTVSGGAADFAGGVLPAGRMTFAPGETTKVVTVNVRADIQKEADEDFIITLSNPSKGGTITTATARGTIRNDDDGRQAYAAVLSLADLDGSNGFVIRNTLNQSGGGLGVSVAMAGDLNDDGLADLLIGAEVGGPDRRGAAYVVYGRGGGFGRAVDVANIGAPNGFSIINVNDGPSVDTRVAGVGDVNGDGLDDLAIGSRFTNDSFGPRAGRVTTVFGSHAQHNILDARNVGGATGFQVLGESFYNIDGGLEGIALGRAVSGAGDINGDGFEDIVAGAWRADVGLGEAYVIFGTASGFASQFAARNLAPPRGFVVENSLEGRGIPYVSSQLGFSVGSAGDVNGDGTDDLIIGANAGNPFDSIVQAGNAYVVFGGEDFSDRLDLGRLDGTNGFRIDGVNELDALGASVSSAGDVNGDGYGDVIVGAAGAGPNGAGSAYVIFGGSSWDEHPLNVAALDGSNGFRLDGLYEREFVGRFVTSAGDWNGDGYDDVVAAGERGHVYLVFGGSGFGSQVSLASLNGRSGIRIDGIPDGESPFVGVPTPTLTGWSVSSGDVNGDGLSDLLIGAPQASPQDSGATVHGEAYVLYGALPQAPVMRVGSIVGQTIYGGGFSDTLDGRGGDDLLHGGAGNDRLIGGDGGDALDGGKGNDILEGGAGNDIYRVDNARDVVIEKSGRGSDRVNSSVSFSLGGQYIERLVLMGSGSINGTGNSLANTLTGNSGKNILNGGSGADTMAGGAGDDTYKVDNAGDVVIEKNGQGSDQVNSSVSFSLGGQFIERLVLTGSGNINGTGNSLANTLTGNAGNNVLNGGAGADTMAGGAGDDTYKVDNAGDVVIEKSGQGSDQVSSSVSFSLGGQFIERLTLTGNGNINGTGNSLANTLTGNAGSNVLNGGSGADTMAGGAGNDTYKVDNAGDVVIEKSGEGSDRVSSSVSFSLSGQYVERLTLTGSGNINGIGNSLDNILTGNAGNNILTGGSGKDTLTGGAGADTFLFRTALATSNIDTITDFNVAADTIRLDNAIFDTIVGTGILSLAQFAANASGTARDANDRIIYETDTGKLFFDRNGSAAGGSIQFATLDAGLALSNADFVIV